MSPQEKDFAGICEAPRLEDAVRALNEFRLAKLIAWLRKDAPGGVRRLVLGVAEAEACERFVRAHS